MFSVVSVSRNKGGKRSKPNRKRMLGYRLKQKKENIEKIFARRKNCKL